MKYCPKCQDHALYEDEEMFCPICKEVLVPYYVNQNPKYADTRDYQYEEYHSSQIDTQAFYTHGIGSDHYHGIIADMNHYTQIYPFFIKVIRAIIYGEPFQIGMLSQYTSITIEEIRFDDIPEQRRSFQYYGDLNGQIYEGQVVDIQTKFNRRQIHRIMDSQTHRELHSPFSIPRWIFVLMILLIPLWIPLIMNVFLAFFSGLLQMSFSLLNALAIPVIVIFVIFYLLRSLF